MKAVEVKESGGSGHDGDIAIHRVKSFALSELVQTIEVNIYRLDKIWRHVIAHLLIVMNCVAPVRHQDTDNCASLACLLRSWTTSCGGSAAMRAGGAGRLAWNDDGQDACSAAGYCGKGLCTSRSSGRPQVSSL